jgi:hypothetical protein
MNNESQEVKKLFGKLYRQTPYHFPQRRGKLEAPSRHGVYIILRKKTVLHVGRTLRGKKGLFQRLKNHLNGSSSFTKKHLKKKGSKLRKNEYRYQYLELEKPRKRAILEAYAIGMLCPKHIGLGE